MTSGPNRPAQLGIERLNGIRGTQNPQTLPGKAWNASGVIAVNPVAQGLPIRSRQPCGPRPVHSIERVGDRDQPGADPPVALPPLPRDGGARH
jgi:hypothetical protein